MEPKQYRFLYWDCERDEFRLLGYPLLLSPTEKTIVVALMQSEPIEDALASVGQKPHSKQNLAVHVNAINRKAAAISGRKLIGFEDGKYRLVVAM